MEYFAVQTNLSVCRCGQYLMTNIAHEMTPKTLNIGIVWFIFYRKYPIWCPQCGRAMQQKSNKIKCVKSSKLDHSAFTWKINICIYHWICIEVNTIIYLYLPISFILFALLSIVRWTLLCINHFLFAPVLIRSNISLLFYHRFA